LGTSITAKWFFSDLDWVGTPGVITDLVPVGDLTPGVILSFTADSIDIITNISNSPGESKVLQFQIVTEHAQSVPAPAAVVLLLCGLAGLGALRTVARPR
jgi:hypothetical protein